MQVLMDRIVKDGRVLKGDILKVDSFLNHQIDVELLDLIGAAFYEKFKNRAVTKILTIEASGIAIASVTARFFHCPLLFAKKTPTTNLSPDVYTAEVASYTHKTTYNIKVAKQYLSADDRVLIVDDFAANGNALNGLISLTKQAGATVVGAGIAIEKGYQGGGDELRAQGYDIYSLAIIEKMNADGSIIFRK